MTVVEVSEVDMESLKVKGVVHVHLIAFPYLSNGLAGMRAWGVDRDEASLALKWKL